MAYILQDFEIFELWKIERQDLVEFTKFVLRIYYQHHQNIPPPVKEVENCIKEDERLYPYTHFYAIKTKDGQIFGTINVCLWNGEAKLAIEQEYNLDIKQLIKERGLNPPEIWHIGRFAIDRTIINRSETLKSKHSFYFQLLLVCALVHICTKPNNLMIAECDVKLQKALMAVGIFCEKLSEGHFVLGSQALPVINTGEGLQTFFDKYKYLLNYYI